MSAIEADVLYNRHGFNLYRHCMNTTWNHSGTNDLLVYLGGGAFGGNWDEEFSTGIAAVAGIEYTLRDLPLNFSIDWKPMMNIYRHL